MLKHRIIPILLFNNKLQVVQTTRFQRPYRVCGTLMQYVRTFEERNVDEIILLDIDATKEGREPNFSSIKEVCTHFFCPVTYGGGVSKIDHISKLIQECGVDKVAICSALLDASLIQNSAIKYGSQAIVASLNIKDNMNYYLRSIHATVETCALWYEEFGAGELLLTSVNNNGIQCGYDTELLEKIENINIPVVINGGCSKPLDMVAAIKLGANAVAASTMFLYTETTPRDCARALQEAGVPVRVE
jgi:cyclase